MSRGAALLYGCLMGYGGRVIASDHLGSLRVEDGDNLSSAVGSILEFVARMYPSSQHTPFEALDHGPVRVLVERGQFCMLLLVIEGREDEAVRTGMREILGRFEARNGAKLAADDPGRRIRKDARDTLSTASNLMKVF